MSDNVKQYLPQLAETLDAAESNFSRWTSQVVLYAKATDNRDILLEPAPSEPVKPSPMESPSTAAEASQQKEDEDNYVVELKSYRDCIRF